MSESMKPRDSNWARRIERFVEEHPGIGIGTAICLGVLLGWVTKQR